MKTVRQQAKIDRVQIMKQGIEDAIKDFNINGEEEVNYWGRTDWGVILVLNN